MRAEDSLKPRLNIILTSWSALLWCGAKMTSSNVIFTDAVCTRGRQGAASACAESASPGQFGAGPPFSKDAFNIISEFLFFYHLSQPGNPTHFIIVMDNTAIIWMISKQQLKHKLARWILTLHDYTYSLRHRLALYNRVADPLSRNPVSSGSSHDQDHWILFSPPRSQQGTAPGR